MPRYIYNVTSTLIHHLIGPRSVSTFIGIFANKMLIGPKARLRDELQY